MGSGIDNLCATIKSAGSLTLFCRLRRLANPVKFDGDTFRSVFDTGAEASFKISRTWENVQSRALGLDGLMHVIQPFTDFSYVKEDGPNPDVNFGVRSVSAFDPAAGD